MNLSNVLAILLLSAATTAYAANIDVRPSDPRSVEPVTLLVTFPGSCPSAPTVERQGFAIQVTTWVGDCLIPAFPHLAELPLGVLPAGVYTVTVDHEYAPSETATFQVLAVEPSMELSPTVGPTAGGTRVWIETELPWCSTDPSTPCPPTTVTFGGTQVQVATRNQQFFVTTPPGVAGAAPVTVTRGDVSHTTYAFRYYDPNAEPMPEIFDRFLIPTFYNGPGQHGSSWATELAVRNANSWPVELFRDPDALPVIEPDATHIMGVRDGQQGRFIIVPRESAARMHFNALVREVTPPFESWGTELPVVHEHHFGQEVELLNVPVYPGFRGFLRIYGLDAEGAFVSVNLRSMLDGRWVGGRTIRLTCGGACTPDQPAYAGISDLFDSLELSPSERVAIRIQSYDAPLWAYVTITNNTTQNTTVISPQMGEPVEFVRLTALH